MAILKSIYDYTGDITIMSGVINIFSSIYLMLQLDMTDKRSLLGSFCREESPRLCDHALLSMQHELHDLAHLPKVT